MWVAVALRATPMALDFLELSSASFLAPSSPTVFCIFRVWCFFVVKPKLTHGKKSGRLVIASTGHVFVAAPGSESQQFMTDPLILVAPAF
jgi:hypothetical protein